eukprot:5004193-Alexandrium_andersonii.AAC.1
MTTPYFRTCPATLLPWTQPRVPTWCLSSRATGGSKLTPLRHTLRQSSVGHPPGFAPEAPVATGVD